MKEELIRLESEDLAAAAAVHARAFEHDPYFSFTLQDAARRPRQVAFLMRVVLNYCLLYGEIYATPDLKAVAAWLPPGTGRESPWRMIRSGALPSLWRIGPAAILRSRQLDRVCDRMHARYAPEPHWYLSQLGVDPPVQGMGYGQRVLRPTLEQIDREQKAAYLETLNPRAVPFYQKLGFSICEQVDMPGGGPVVWSMLRSPRPA